MRVRGLLFSNIAIKDQLRRFTETSLQFGQCVRIPSRATRDERRCRQSTVLRRKHCALCALCGLEQGKGLSMHCTGYSRAGIQFFCCGVLVKPGPSPPASFFTTASYCRVFVLMRG